jgi:hypothetical protein
MTLSEGLYLAGMGGYALVMLFFTGWVVKDWWNQYGPRR